MHHMKIISAHNYDSDIRIIYEACAAKMRLYRSKSVIVNLDEMGHGNECP